MAQRVRLHVDQPTLMQPAHFAPGQMGGGAMVAGDELGQGARRRRSCCGIRGRIDHQLRHQEDGQADIEAAGDRPGDGPHRGPAVCLSVRMQPRSPARRLVQQICGSQREQLGAIPDRPAEAAPLFRGYLMEEVDRG